MVTTSIAMTKVLNELGVFADVTAGLSLGEYAALFAAGVMREEDAITVVRQRGILMQEAVPAGIGAMAAILALENETIEKVTKRYRRRVDLPTTTARDRRLSPEKGSRRLSLRKLKEAGGAKRTRFL